MGVGITLVVVILIVCIVVCIMRRKKSTEMVEPENHNVVRVT